MTTNQTIDGVRRELLQKIADGGYCHQGLMDELRALLDAPSDKPIGHCSDWLNCCCGGDTPLVREGCANWVSWKKPDVSLTDEGEKPAAQPHGEPVAYQFQDRDGKWCGFMNERHYQSTVSDGTWPIRALYAEQPAPVADPLAKGFTTLESDSGKYKIVTSFVTRDDAWSAYRALLGAKPAPVAVVHPFAEKVIRKLERLQECADDGQGADIGRHWLDLLTQLGLLNRVQRSPALWEMIQQGEDALELSRQSAKSR